MKIAVFGRHTTEIDNLAKSNGFEVVKENPEVVISHGGDGTLILSEFHYPGIPKLLLKSSQICKLCEPFSNEEILERFKGGKYKTRSIAKLEVEAKGKNLHAMNDIILHNDDPRHAIRYHVRLNDEPIPHHEVIGDGVVVSTPFGSTGYYKSITGSIFTTGIGLAFNNSTEQSDHVVLSEHDVIKIIITRGPATIYADNQDESISLTEGDEIIIKKSKHSAHIIQVGN